MSTYPARVTEGILLGNTREIKCGISKTIIGRIQGKNLGWIFFKEIFEKSLEKMLQFLKKFQEFQVNKFKEKSKQEFLEQSQQEPLEKS